MVNLLWRVNHPATRQLEELWNEAIELHSVAVLCGYRVDVGEADSHFPGELRALHSHLIPVEAGFSPPRLRLHVPPLLTGLAPPPRMLIPIGQEVSIVRRQ